MSDEKVLMRSALAVLAELQNGDCVGKLSAAFHEATAAVKAHGKPATVTLTLTIAMLKETRLVDMPLLVTPEITSKLPKPAEEPTVFFPNANGDLVRNPTIQQELPMSVVKLGDSNNG